MGWKTCKKSLSSKIVFRIIEDEICPKCFDYVLNRYSGLSIKLFTLDWLHGPDIYENIWKERKEGASYRYIAFLYQMAEKEIMRICKRMRRIERGQSPPLKKRIEENIPEWRTLVKERIKKYKRKGKPYRLNYYSEIRNLRENLCLNCYILFMRRVGGIVLHVPNAEQYFSEKIYRDVWKMRTEKGMNYSRLGKMFSMKKDKIMRICKRLEEEEKEKKELTDVVRI